MNRLNVRKELEELRAEIESLRGKGAASSPPPAATPPEESVIEHQLAELTGMVQTMLDEAEETIAEHPVVTVAGALALGIVIGRLTAR